MEPLVRTSGNTVYPGMVHKPEENLDTTQPYKYVVVLGDGAKKILTFESLITTPYLKQITKITTTGNGQSLKRHLKWNQNITLSATILEKQDKTLLFPHLLEHQLWWGVKT